MSVSLHTRTSDPRRFQDLSALGRCFLEEVGECDWRGCLQFLRLHKRIISKPEIQAFLAQAQRAGEKSIARTCVHHALILRKWDQLGEKGGEDFLIRLIEGNRQDKEAFLDDVDKEYDQLRRGRPGAGRDPNQGEGLAHSDTERYGRAGNLDRSRNQPDWPLDSVTVFPRNQNCLASRANGRRDYDTNTKGTESSISSGLQDLRIDSPRPVESRASLNKFFLLAEDIHPQVIKGWAVQYLGKDTTVRQGKHPKNVSVNRMSASQRDAKPNIGQTRVFNRQSYHHNEGK
jgi:hypothetical protein